MRTRLESPLTAWIITVLVMILASLLGGRAALAEMRAAAWELYAGGYAEREGEYASIQYDLGEIASDAYNLVTVAERYLEPEDALLLTIRADCDIMTANDAPAVRKRSADDLKASVEELDARLGSLELNADDQEYRYELKANIESRFRTIGNNAYNTLAGDFNRELDSQPAALIAALTGVERLELYDDTLLQD